MSLYTGVVARASVIEDMEYILTDLQSIYDANNPRLVEMLMVASNDVEKQMLDRKLIKQRLSEQQYMSILDFEFQKAAENTELLTNNVPIFIRRIMHWWNSNIPVKYDTSIPSVDQLWNKEIGTEQEKSIILMDWIRSRKTFHVDNGTFRWMAERLIADQIDMSLLRMIVKCEQHMKAIDDYLNEFNSVDFSVTKNQILYWYKQMKYRHDFDIWHLPKVVAGLSVATFGVACAGVALYQWLNGMGDGETVLLTIVGAVIIYGGLFLATEGIEYTHELNVYPEKDQLSLIVSAHTKSWQDNNHMSDMEMIKWLNNAHPSIEKRRKNVINTKYLIDEIDTEIDERIKHERTIEDDIDDELAKNKRDRIAAVADIDEEIERLKMMPRRMNDVPSK